LLPADVIRDSVTYTEHAKRKTVTSLDVVYALKRAGKTLYGLYVHPRPSSLVARSLADGDPSAAAHKHEFRVDLAEEEGGDFEFQQSLLLPSIYRYPAIPMRVTRLVCFVCFVYLLRCRRRDGVRLRSKVESTRSFPSRRPFVAPRMPAPSKSKYTSPPPTQTDLNAFVGAKPVARQKTLGAMFKKAAGKDDVAGAVQDEVEAVVVEEDQEMEEVKLAGQFRVTARGRQEQS
jgi:hypothetical protein